VAQHIIVKNCFELLNTLAIVLLLVRGCKYNYK